jgi:hypothetical protein
MIIYIAFIINLDIDNIIKNFLGNNTINLYYPLICNTGKFAYELFELKLLYNEHIKIWQNWYNIALQVFIYNASNFGCKICIMSFSKYVIPGWYLMAYSDN